MQEVRTKPLYNTADETRLHKTLCEPDKPDQILHCIHSVILEKRDLGAEMHAITWHHRLSFDI